MIKPRFTRLWRCHKSDFLQISPVFWLLNHLFPFLTWPNQHLHEWRAGWVEGQPFGVGERPWQLGWGFTGEAFSEGFFSKQPGCQWNDVKWTKLAHAETIQTYPNSIAPYCTLAASKSTPHPSLHPPQLFCSKPARRRYLSLLGTPSAPSSHNCICTK